jgi:hypothetical protein
MTMEESLSKAEHYRAAEIMSTREQLHLVGKGQIHATLALACEVSELTAVLAGVQAFLSMIYDQLGSIEQAIGRPTAP